MLRVFLVILSLVSTLAFSEPKEPNELFQDYISYITGDPYELYVNESPALKRITYKIISYSYGTIDKKSTIRNIQNIQDISFTYNWSNAVDAFARENNLTQAEARQRFGRLLDNRNILLTKKMENIIKRDSDLKLGAAIVFGGIAGYFFSRLYRPKEIKEIFRMSPELTKKIRLQWASYGFGAGALGAGLGGSIPEKLLVGKTIEEVYQLTKIRSTFNDTNKDSKSLEDLDNVLK